MKYTVENLAISQEMDILKTIIVEILKEWKTPNGEFVGFWRGYDALWYEIIDKNFLFLMPGVKHAMKKLAKEGVVELRPLLNSEGKLCGKGWFLKQESKEMINERRN